MERTLCRFPIVGYCTAQVIEFMCPIMLGQIPAQAWLHVLVLLAYGSVGFYIALGLTRKRLLS